MKDTLKDLKPKIVFEIFSQLCNIPHGSGNCSAIADYCEAYAESHGCDVIRDRADNLIITIPATKGYENTSRVILQGHMDMVCAKAISSTHNFETDPLTLQMEGDWLMADNTTLGGDDGIGVAMILALTADKAIPHGTLYGVLTTDEEIGMLGAEALDLSPAADAAYMINLDSEAEGIFYAGCAGGARFSTSFPVNSITAKGSAVTLILEGLDGGHSGEAIQHYGYNGIILLADILTQLKKDHDFNLMDITNGLQDNVIPKEAKARLLMAPDRIPSFEKSLSELEAIYRSSRPGIDTQMRFSLQYGNETEAPVLDPDSEAKVLHLISQFPNGVITSGIASRGIVDTSLNLGIVILDQNTLSLKTLIRSNRTHCRELLLDKLKAFTEYFGGTWEVSGVYPPWEFKPNAILQKLIAEKWQSLTGNVPCITTMHAGLECGFFYNKLSHLDIVSMGPTILDIHTPRERLEISSTQRTWELLCGILSEIQ